MPEQKITAPYRKLSGLKPSAVSETILSKLVQDPNTGRSGFRHPDGSVSPTISTLKSLSGLIAQNSNDAENIFASLPDTELAMQILVSSILSPTDLRAAELTWYLDDVDLDAEMSGKMLEVIKDYFEDDYKIKKILPKALEDSLFKTGSYPLAVIPESAVDDIINNRDNKISTESISSEFNGKLATPLGILGPREVKKSSSSEAHGASYGMTHADQTIHTGLVITDNFNALKYPMLNAKSVRSKVATAIRSKLHKRSGSTESTIVYKDGMDMRSTSGANLMLKVKTADRTSRPTQGNPLVMKLPSESVIPIHVPSDPENHLGYFVLLDEYGNPINASRDSDHYSRLLNSKMASNSENMASSLLSKLGGQYGAELGSEKAKHTLQELTYSYSTLLEKDLLDRLRNGVYGDNVEIDAPEEIYRIMLARALSGMTTQILYLPEELLTYIAFDYNKLGIGRSLLEKSKILASIRAVLLYSNTMAATRNSINRRTLNLTIDPDDPEPEKTVERMLTEYGKVQSRSIPLDTTSPTDIVNGIRAANTSVVISGTSAFPDTKMEVEDGQSNRVMVDSDLDDKMRDRHIMSMGLTPEMIDATANVDFAVSVINSNLLFTKRLAIYQEKTTDFIKDHVVKYTLNSGMLLSKLLEILKSGANPIIATEDVSAYSVANGEEVKGEVQSDNVDYMDIVELFLEGLKISLPAPDQTRLENQLNLYQQYVAMLDAILPAYVNEELLDTMFEESEERVPTETLLMVIKGYFLRTWLANNNVMPELKELIEKDIDNEATLDLLEKYTAHSSGLMETIKGFIFKMKDVPATEEEETTDADSSDTEDTQEESEVTESSVDDADAEADEEFDVDLDDDKTSPKEEEVTEVAEPEAKDETEEVPLPADSDDDFDIDIEDEKK